MEGIDWALSNTPPQEAYDAVCETPDEAAARRQRDESLAKFYARSTPDPIA